ncbi:hypothetical protein V6N13_140342 [Hibiscus sabdariffa]|uniref:Secreted protein n=1 Tax=Hibiscus sabdariffa TaxID=183260 RepID=A0ABR2QAV0_9ROSI
MYHAPPPIAIAIAISILIRGGEGRKVGNITATAAAAAAAAAATVVGRQAHQTCIVKSKFGVGLTEDPPFGLSISLR